ncbi:hypothetical protein [Helicobacter cetorum]|uniref:hypothetical protein n=1 Tax=Helicobacter cetorum TaxID=138563 RepID=UPI0013151B65|nr:hypothetical protein [Helicobacter cetorum]
MRLIIISFTLLPFMDFTITELLGIKKRQNDSMYFLKLIRYMYFLKKLIHFEKVFLRELNHNKSIRKNLY